jgi:hypothetical protein
MRGILSTILITTAILTIAGSAAAIPGAGAINMTFNTSARLEGMGGSGVGAPWGMDTNHWANPALLAFRPGIHYSKFESKLAEGLADDIWLTNEELTFGGYGVTVLHATMPMQGNYLDMGEQTAYDEQGNPIGTFRSYMRSRTWGFAVDAVVLAENLFAEEEKFLSRILSMSVGYTWTEFEDSLGFMETYPGQITEISGSGETESMGATIRFTPFNITRGKGLFNNGVFGLRMGAAYGVALLNDSDQYIVHLDEMYRDPFPRMAMEGWSAHAALPFAEGLRETHDGFLRLLIDTFDPLVSFTYAAHTMKPGVYWDPVYEDYVYGIDGDESHWEKGWGWELGFANLFYFRQGYVEAPWGDIDDATEGMGLNLQLGRMGGYRYDWAKTPQAQGLPKVTRESWSVWVDPFAIAGYFQK